MKITKSRLKQIIKEELESVLNEDAASDQARAAELSAASDASAASGREVEEEKIIAAAKAAHVKHRALVPYFNDQWNKLQKKILDPGGGEIGKSSRQLINIFFGPWDRIKSALGPRYKFVQAAKNEIHSVIGEVVHYQNNADLAGFLPWTGSFLREALRDAHTLLGGIGHLGEERAREARAFATRGAANDRRRERGVKWRKHLDAGGGVGPGSGLQKGRSMRYAVRPPRTGEISPGKENR